MANRKKKVTEDTIVFLGDIRGTIAFIREKMDAVEGALGLDGISGPEGGLRKVKDPEAFETLINDIANQIFQAHLRLEDVLDKFRRAA